MEARAIQRPAIDILRNRCHNLLALNAPLRRHESSYRRTKQRLNIMPERTMLPSKTSQPDEIIFNPPSSIPSVFHTPLKFLPKEDKRRQLSMRPQSAQALSRLPPPVKPKSLKLARGHLSEVEIEEMRKLRLKQPEFWSTQKLATKFKCSSFFVTMVLSHLPGDGGIVEETRKSRAAAKLDAVKERWGPRRRMAREDRAKRVELALKDA